MVAGQHVMNMQPGMVAGQPGAAPVQIIYVQGPPPARIGVKDSTKWNLRKGLPPCLTLFQERCVKWKIVASKLTSNVVINSITLLVVCAVLGPSSSVAELSAKTI